MSAFTDWLAKSMPLIAAGADRIDVYRNARDAMEIAWDGAIAAALRQVPGGDTCKPADVADAIRALHHDARPSQGDTP